MGARSLTPCLADFSLFLFLFLSLCRAAQTNRENLTKGKQEGSRHGPSRVDACGLCQLRREKAR